MAVATAGGSRSYNFKIVLLGEGCVGKTSLVLRYVEDKFNDRHITTLQVQVKSPLPCYSCVLKFSSTGKGAVSYNHLLFSEHTFPMV